MKTTNRILLILIALSLSIVACKKDDSDDFKDQNFEEVATDFMQKIEHMETPGALANSDDTYAQNAKANFELLKGMATSFSGLFYIPADATTKSVNMNKSQSLDKNSALDNGKTYTWDDGNGTSIVYKVVEQNDRYVLTYNFYSPYFEGKLMDGYMKKDGSYGEVNYYIDGGEVDFKMNWTLNENSYKYNFLSESMNMTMDYNFDTNECRMASYIDGDLYSEWYWDATGNGWYKVLNYDGSYTTHNWTA